MKTNTANSVADKSLDDFRIEELESALHDRDQLVEMLTEQLEQAADQLDRLQRIGPQRGNSGGDSDTSMSAEQQGMLEQLNRVLRDWEDAHATQTLSRIEREVLEIRELLSNGENVSHAPSKSIAEQWSLNSASRPAAGPAPATSAGSATTDWESIKAAMLAEDPGATLGTSPKPTAADSKPSVVNEHDPATAPRHDTAPLPDPPAEIDLEKASPDELRQALQVRDDYIALLVRRLTSAPPPATPNWEVLNQAPPELRTELETLRDDWQSRIRTAQVDLALQRAKLAREDARLQTLSASVYRQQKQLGITPDDPKAKASSPDSKNGNSGRRWMSFLQRPNS